MRIGLVNEVVPRAELDAAVARWVDDVLACAPLSVRAIKQVVRRTAQLTAARGRRRSGCRRSSRRCSRRTADEGVRAFVEKRKPVWKGASTMPYVITDACIDVKDKTCLDACPVDCIYEGGRTLYIQPDECIDCGLCETVCPVAAIHADDRLPEELEALARHQSRILRPRGDRLGPARAARTSAIRPTRTTPSSREWPARDPSP